MPWKTKKGVTHPELAKENPISSQNGELAGATKGSAQAHIWKRDLFISWV